MEDGWSNQCVLPDFSCFVLSVRLCGLTLSPISRQVYMTEHNDGILILMLDITVFKSFYIQP